MDYQCTQPCLPPPICGQQCSPEAKEPSMCASLCNSTCAETRYGASASISYQSKQPCVPPPISLQPCPTENAYACTPTFVPLCNAVIAEPEPVPCAEAHSSAGVPHVEQPNFALPSIIQPYTSATADPGMTTHSHANAEASPASSPEPMPAYVVPGSVVSLHPSGCVTVRPAPVEDVPASVGEYMPHLS